MGKACATLVNKQDAKILNYKLVKGEDIIWKLK